MLEDYVEVAERIAQFYEKFPDGRLVKAGRPYTMRLGGPGMEGKDYIVYEALAYRTADDTLPAPGSAWEPWPGPTQFTKDSELMNAETAAIGRAIVMAGIPSKKIASAEEVQARAGAPESASNGTAARSLGAYTDWLVAAVRSHDTSRYDTPEKLEALKGDGSEEHLRGVVPALKAELTELGADVKLIDQRFLERTTGVAA